MSDAFDPNRETEQEYSERMHAENDPHIDWGARSEYDVCDFDDEPDECPHCGGTGWQDLNGTMSMECPECGGDGY